jgi:predicted histidine transporter YuiF (NhaC family)
VSRLNSGFVCALISLITSFLLSDLTIHIGFGMWLVYPLITWNYFKVDFKHMIGIFLTKGIFPFLNVIYLSYCLLFRNLFLYSLKLYKKKKSCMIPQLHLFFLWKIPQFCERFLNPFRVIILDPFPFLLIIDFYHQC